MTARHPCCKRDVRSRKPERITAPVQHHFHEVALDGAYASGFAVGILILLVAFFVFEPRTAPSQK